MTFRAKWSADIQEIQKRMASEFSLTIAELLSERRFHRFITPRHLTMYLCRHITDASLVTIGYYFRHRDHTTIRSGILHAEKIMDADFPLSLKVRRIARELKASNKINNQPSRKG